MSTPHEHHRVVVIGAGFSGLGAAIRLRGSGERDLVVLERADDVGGCWHANTYPGLRCDVQSVVYSFSFAPNPDWSRSFPSGPEIRTYLRRVAREFDVYPHIRFDTEVREVRWDAARQIWLIDTSQGPLTAEIVLSGHGALSEPKVPDIPGLDTFEGEVFHSARWRHDVALEGERVAVVGTGASAIQIIPAIQPRVAELQVYQRTPAWVLPRPDHPVADALRATYRALPFVQKLARAWRFLTLETRVLGMLTRPELLTLAERAAKRHIARHVADPDLRDRLTPSYAMGCKRVLLSNDYYPALAAPNAELVADSIREVRPEGIVTADGTLREADVIVLCTGFHVSDHPMAQRVVGSDGRSLAEHWADGAQAYLGMTVPHFPNLFLLLTGPHTGLGHNSIVYMIEAQLAYVAQALAVQRARDHAVMEVRDEVTQAFTDEMDDRLEGTVWSSGCTSFYLDDAGRNIAIWPGFAMSYRQRTRSFEPACFTFQPRRAPLDRADDARGAA